MKKMMMMMVVVVKRMMMRLQAVRAASARLYVSFVEPWSWLAREGAIAMSMKSAVIHQQFMELE